MNGFVREPAVNPPPQRIVIPAAQRAIWQDKIRRRLLDPEALTYVAGVALAALDWTELEARRLRFPIHQVAANAADTMDAANAIIRSLE